jgi:hypothetical protein
MTETETVNIGIGRGRETTTAITTETEIGNGNGTETEIETGTETEGVETEGEHNEFVFDNPNTFVLVIDLLDTVEVTAMIGAESILTFLQSVGQCLLALLREVIAMFLDGVFLAHRRHEHGLDLVLLIRDVDVPSQEHHPHVTGIGENLGRLPVGARDHDRLLGEGDRRFHAQFLHHIGIRDSEGEPLHHPDIIGLRKDHPL